MHFYADKIPCSEHFSAHTKTQGVQMLKRKRINDKELRTKLALRTMELAGGTLLASLKHGRVSDFMVYDFELALSAITDVLDEHWKD